MMVEKHLLEALDALRPGSDDLSQPEMAELAQRLEQEPELADLLDRLQAGEARLAEAMEDVPVPADLAARLAAAVRADSAALCETSAAEGDDALTFRPDAAPAAALPGAGRGSRRWMVVAAVAAALLVAAGVVVWQRPAGTIGVDALRQQLAAAWFERAWEQDAWRGLDTAPRDYPVSSRVIPRARRWQRVATEVDRRAVAYDLTPPGATERITLHVVKLSDPQAEALASLGRVPPRRAFQTLGRSIAAWQTDGLLYVLVVEGHADRYRNAVRADAGLSA